MITTPSTYPPQHLLGGLNVVIVAPASGAPQMDAIRTGLEESGVLVVPYTTLPHADADAFDAVVIAGAADALAQVLRQDPGLLDFLRRLEKEHKPAAALGDGVSLLEAAGGDRTRWLTAAADAPLDAFLLQLKERLVQRRCDGRTTPADNTPSAVGEDG
jgi:putative intracellular protease/amidase